jgi:hypothetical protein
MEEKSKITGTNPKASFRALYPPLRGIVQLANSDALRFRNWSFTNKELQGFGCMAAGDGNKRY